MLLGQRQCRPLNCNSYIFRIGRTATEARDGWLITALSDAPVSHRFGASFFSERDPPVRCCKGGGNF
jgi:hypothetical protein